MKNTIYTPIYNIFDRKQLNINLSIKLKEELDKYVLENKPYSPEISISFLIREVITMKGKEEFDKQENKSLYIRNVMDEWLKVIARRK